MDAPSTIQSAIPLPTQFVLKVVGAVALWVIARRLIRLAARLLVLAPRPTSRRSPLRRSVRCWA